MLIMKRILALLCAILVLPAMAAAQDSYRIQPGDVLRVEVLEDSSINRDALVLPDGRISIPMAGTVPAAGRTISQVQSAVTQRLSPNFSNAPTVFVSISKLRERERVTATAPVEKTIDIFVMGEVTQPGKVSVAEGTTLLQALAQIGGFSKFAATKRVQLRRADKSGRERVYNINYNDILAGTSSIGMTTLAEGDVIIVPERRLFE
jgi:polysaccharide export outer membrane protein